MRHYNTICNEFCKGKYSLLNSIMVLYGLYGLLASPLSALDKT